MAIAEFSSVLSRDHNARHDYNDALLTRSRLKRKKYSPYAIPSNLLFLVSFGRTNVLSKDAVDFFAFIDSYFPHSMGVKMRLLAVMGHAITTSAARVVNMAVRRAQIATANAAPVSFIKSMLPSFCAIERTFSKKVPETRRGAHAYPIEPFPLTPQRALALFARIGGVSPLPELPIAADSGALSSADSSQKSSALEVGRGGVFGHRARPSTVGV